MPRQGSGGTVTPLERDGARPGIRPIPGMRAGWLYREADRMILHSGGRDSVPLPIDTVPKVCGTILHLTDDGETVRIEYLITGKRQRRPRIVTEDELDRGTWASKVGQHRPSSADAKQAFATIMRADACQAEEMPARAHYNEDGDLVMPTADAQVYGYRVTAGTEEQARENWEEIAAWAILDPKSALVLGAVFAGPILDAIEVHAHIVNLVGTGQQGKSTALTTAAALLGDVKPRRQKLLSTWNSSKQGITQGLRGRTFLPVCLDEHSSSGRTVKDSSKEFSQIVAGAIREMGGPEGSVRDLDGFWHSVLVSSSNDRLRFVGQTEDLASRLHEISAPFFPNIWVDADGSRVDSKAGGAEHLSQRIKRLAKASGGWPLEWAVRLGMFRAENLRALKRAQLELSAKHRTGSGGIPDTIVALHMAWVVGALMLEKALGVTGLGAAAEAAAAERVSTAIEEAAEANMPDGEKLWIALDGMRLEASAYPEMEDLAKAANDSFRKVKGFVRGPEWWVLDSVVKQAAIEAGVENVMTALRHLDEAGVHVRGDGRPQRQVPREVERMREAPKRLHLFRTDRADEVFGGVSPGAPSGEFPSAPTPAPTLHPGQVGADSWPLTCGAPSAPSAPTLLELTLVTREDRGEVGADLGAAEAPADGVVTSVRSDATIYPEAVRLSASAPGVSGTWQFLESAAQGRTRAALRIGVLGADGLYLPNRRPVAVPLPGNVDQVPELMAAYGLKTLWVHESAALEMGLPTHEVRRQGPRVDGKIPGRDPNSSVSAQVYTVHPWAEPASGSALTVTGGGLSAWMTLETPDTGKGKERLFLSLPMYDRRADRIDLEGRRQAAGFAAAKSPAELLDAVMLFTEVSRHGRDDDPRLIPFYQSANKTASDYADGDRGTPEGTVSLVIRDKAVPPVLSAAKPLLNMQWTRHPDRLTNAERCSLWLHQYDRNASYLPAFGGALLGLGEPDHHADGCAYDKTKAGYWRVAELPGLGLEDLPPLTIDEAAEGGYWVRTPGMDLLRELYPAWVPSVVEAWVWPNSRRALDPFYKRVAKARARVLEAQAAGRPGAKCAKQMVGKLYQSFWGFLARTKGPLVDHATGGWYAKDPYWRPDWSQMVLDVALANTYRAILKAAANGHKPLSLRVDAVTYASNEVDAVAAAPAWLELSDLNGKWKAEPEKTVPLAAVLPKMADGQMAPDAVREYLRALHKDAEVFGLDDETEE